MWYSYKPYVSVAQRRVNAAKEIKKITKNGRAVLPVQIAGRKIASSFWGKAWCDNLESYSDFSNRLPRGRTYVRNGSVCDLQIEPGRVTAMVCGSQLYKINISIDPVKPDYWAMLKKEFTGQIGAAVELLQGRLSESVMRIITRPGGGLFPQPSEIKLDCSCPDWADMCKHVAAALYGVGARLDQQPELLFVLRKVDHLELITDAVNIAIPADASVGRKRIAAEDVSDVFGIEISDPSTNSAANTAMTFKPVDAVPAVKSARRSKRAASADHGKKVDRPAQNTSNAKPAKTAKRQVPQSARSRAATVRSGSRNRVNTQNVK